MSIRSSDVDEYIARQSAWKRPILVGIRKAIHKADPGIVESIKWGSPSFEDHGQVVWLFCAEDWVHVSFRYGSLLKVPHATWVEADDTPSKAKRTMKFEKGAAVPDELLADLVRQAVANNRAGKRVAFDAPAPGSKQFALPPTYKTWLETAGKLEDYKQRPYYQQKGWIQWIESAKTEQTKQARMDRVLIELKHGQYMPNRADRHKD